MKIALVAQHSTPIPTGTGAGTASAGDDARLVEMSKSLAGEGHQVTVYARRNGKTLPERAELAPGVSVEYVGPADSHPPAITPPASRPHPRRPPAPPTAPMSVAGVVDGRAEKFFLAGGVQPAARGPRLTPVVPTTQARPRHLGVRARAATFSSL